MDRVEIKIVRMIAPKQFIYNGGHEAYLDLQKRGIVFRKIARVLRTTFPEDAEMFDGM